MIPASQIRPISQGPAPLEVGVVFAVTVALSMATALSIRALLQGSPYLTLTSWASHLVQLVIPGLWYQLRVAPAIPAERRILFRWRSAGTRLFGVMAIWILVFKLVPSIAEAFLSPVPRWVQAGMGPIAATLLFQGMWVGLTEEMFMRPALQLPLSLRLKGKVRIGRWELSHALLWTALAFGLFHMPNVLSGQSLVATIEQTTISAQRCCTT
ncbi:MAG: CPBP family glutamic-type intramembrane protease [Symbiobacteriia bacterium]